MIRMISNAGSVSVELNSAAVGLPHLVRTRVIHHAMLLQTRVKAKASGRPGPNAPTGDYRRSIQRRTAPVRADGVTTSEVGTNKPQGRRLELGFTGVDSLGRVYDQPPFPHFGPALDEIAPDFVESMEGLLDELDVRPGR